ncbi:MAG: hypothetical protein GY845_16310 [Planctomycetes bacterium]|nr:hypothetical protein [Planctomycetota bacterium]
MEKSKQIRITEMQNRKKQWSKLEPANGREGMILAKEMREQTKERRRKTVLDMDITRDEI